MRTQDYVQLRDKQMKEMDDLEKLELEDVYTIARKKHFDRMREWGVFKERSKIIWRKFMW